MRSATSSTNRTTNEQAGVRRIRRSLSRVLGREVTPENYDASMSDLRQQAREAARRNAASRAFGKLVPILQKMHSLVADLHDYNGDAAKGAVSDLTSELKEFLERQAGLIAMEAAKA